MGSKNIILNFTIVALALCIAQKALAQDKVYFTTGRTVEGKITEIGPTQIKMLTKARPDGPTYVFNSSTIDSIVYADGTKEFSKGFTLKKDRLENIPELNTWTFDLFGFIYASMSQSYERRLKNGKVGFRIPLYIGYFGGGIAGEGLFLRSKGTFLPYGNGGFSIATGLNPKFYLFKRRVVRAFIGPEATIGYSKGSTYYNNSNYYGYDDYYVLTRNGTFAATGKFGLMFNPVDKFNITLEGGVGIGDFFGGSQPMGVVGVWHIGFAMGTNF